MLVDQNCGGAGRRSHRRHSAGSVALGSSVPSLLTAAFQCVTDGQVRAVASALRTAAGTPEHRIDQVTVFRHNFVTWQLAER
jgi:hypothetical protein